ncbi:MAG: DUF975 family protein, partial [Kiritimatiellae bacterium]|nr:DUF975 family protein [Kiritimatiellia bacterium]
RYRQAWYLKARNPDWPASKCIAESCRMMKGYKWKAFALDFSFLGWLFAACAVVALSFAAGSMLAGTVSLAGAVFVLCYFFAARAVFFRELVSERGGVTADE